MGQLLPRYGCCVPSQNPNFCLENHAQVSSKSFRRQCSNVSAAFSVSEIAAGRASDMINVNTATEEELMTLSGVNRQTAVNIIAYRHQIGAFRRVEDLVLVSGIGATRLEDIRNEICVTDRVHSHSGSASSSRVELDSISASNGSFRNHQRSGSKVKVNVNTANIFQLMKVKGMTSAVAENIVTHRESKGAFRSVNDLVHVKGIKPPLLNILRPYVVVKDVNQLNGCGGNSDLANGKVCKSEKSYSDARLILSPLDLCSNRSVLSADKVAPASILRFATWNVDQCSLEKVGNPGVREVIAMTILENGINILAVQDITSGLVLKMLCDELNAPMLHNVKSWSHPRGRWKSLVPIAQNTSKEAPSVVGFMFDSNFGVKVRSNSQLMSCSIFGNDLAAFCFVVDFMVGRLEFSVANFLVSSKPVENPEFSSWKDLVKSVEELKSGTSLVYAGEFGAFLNSKAELLDAFEKKEYRAVIQKNVFTDISRSDHLGSKCTENIWLNSQASSIFQGFSSVVREGLTSLWIPDGWFWGGLVSCHCPVLADFVLNQKLPEPVT